MGINNFLQDQGSKFPLLLESGIKILSEKMGSVMTKYTSLLPKPETGDENNENH